MNPMWNGGMPDAIPPPPGAQPEFHGAFPGYQQQPHAQHPQQQQPPWWLAGQATPWAHGGGGAGPSWANTPIQPSPWQQQFQQPTPAWAQPQMPRQGWGPAPQGGASPWGGHSGPSTPWDHWNEPPPQSAPASLGFSALAAPPLHESSSGQPVTGTGWFGPGMGSGMPGMHGQSRTDESWEGADDEEWADVRAAWAHADPQHGRPPAWAQGQDPRAAWEEEQAWAARAQGGDPRAAWEEEQAWAARAQGQGGDPRAAWAHDPRAAWAYEGGAPLERTHSWGAQGFRSPGKKKKKRSNSLGGGLQRGAWGTPATFDENHLSRRPEDWRDDYSPRGSSTDIPFSSLFRKKSSAADWAGDTKKRALAKVLEYNATRPHISYDLRYAPEETAYMGNFKPRSQAEMMQPAVSPIAPRMRLVHPRLPWYVDVEAPLTQPGVTLVDVIRTLFKELNRPIGGHDFWNEELGKHEREGLTFAFKRRCGKRGEFAREEMLKGVKRVDFLAACGRSRLPPTTINALSVFIWTTFSSILLVFYLDRRNSSLQNVLLTSHVCMIPECSITPDLYIVLECTYCVYRLHFYWCLTPPPPSECVGLTLLPYFQELGENPNRESVIKHVIFPRVDRNQTTTHTFVLTIKNMPYFSPAPVNVPMAPISAARRIPPNKIAPRLCLLEFHDERHRFG